MYVISYISSNKYAIAPINYRNQNKKKEWAIEVIRALIPAIMASDCYVWSNVHFHGELCVIWKHWYYQKQRGSLMTGIYDIICSN